MMLWRLRAQVRWPPETGLAGWARAQMAVRYQQAVHIRPVTWAAEAPGNAARTGGLFICDLPLADQSAAEDAYATLTAVIQQAVELEPGVGSWVEIHRCDHDHDLEVRAGCEIVARTVHPPPAPAEGETAVWTVGAAYTAGDQVVYDGGLYQCVQSHTAQPGWHPPAVPALWEHLGDYTDPHA